MYKDKKSSNLGYKLQIWIFNGTLTFLPKFNLGSAFFIVIKKPWVLVKSSWLSAVKVRIRFMATFSISEKRASLAELTF